MEFKVTMWGVRGSLPSPMFPSVVQTRIKKVLAHYVSQPIRDIDAYVETIPVYQYGGFGGHTTCFEIETAKGHLIVDGGSALRRVGQKMMLGPCGVGKGEAHILLSHFHWDHLLGIPFFVPIFVKGNHIHFYGVQSELESVVRALFKKPYFPVPFEQLAATVHFHQIPARTRIPFQDFEYAAYSLDHPDPCYGFRFERNGKAFGLSVDNEGIRTTRDALGPDLPLYQNLEVLVFDAQYTVVETTERVNWGHSAAPIGIDLAIREKIPRIFFVHHDPAASDEKIQEAVEQTLAYVKSQNKMSEELGRAPWTGQWEFAWDGLQFQVGK